MGIENLQHERVEDKNIFENEKSELFETVNKQRLEIQLLESILDRVQPMIKRDCNYSNIDKIKKEATYDEENQCWSLPNVRLRTDELPNVAASSRLSSRQMQLLNGRDSFTSRDSMSTVSSKVP